MADISCFSHTFAAQFIHKECYHIGPTAGPSSGVHPRWPPATPHPCSYCIRFCRRGVSPEAEKVQAKFGKRGARIDLNPSLCRVSPHK